MSAQPTLSTPSSLAPVAGALSLSGIFAARSWDTTVPVQHAQLDAMVQAIEHAQREGAVGLGTPAMRQYFTGDGLYAREVRIPAGTLVVGLPHKGTCISILSQGVHETITTERGLMMQHAPYTEVSDDGMQRIGYAHTDCTWTTIHQTPFCATADVMLYHICHTPPELLEGAT